MQPALPALATVMDLLPDAVCVVDPEGRYLYVSAGFERIFGYRSDEILGRRMIELVHPDDRERTQAAAQRIMEGHVQLNFRNRYVRKDGSVIDIRWAARWSPRDRVRIAIAHDITDLVRAEAVQAALLSISQAAQSEADLPAVLASIHLNIGGLLPAANFHVAMVDARQGRVDYPYWCDSVEPAPGTRPLEADTITHRVIRTGQSVLVQPDAAGPDAGDVGRAHALAVPLASAQGLIGALIVRSYAPDPGYTADDLQHLEFVAAQVAAACVRSRSRTLLEHLAHHDALTDLPNRRRFHVMLQHALDTNAPGEEPLRLAVLYLDLDGFKAVNDTCGHQVGDQLLLEVARRIRRCIRQSDMVARLGGDEFAVLLHGIGAPATAHSIAEQIRASLNRPYRLDRHTVQVSASIGIALHPEDGTARKTLLRHADDAMYAAKRQGGNRVAHDRSAP